jgi:hypothetical protein
MPGKQELVKWKTAEKGQQVLQGSTAELAISG